jgi:KaiC/GvpD/RAD55 family RecA-like ATPase
MTASMDLLRFDQDALTAELEAAGAQVRGTAVKCPFHEDKNASGGLYQDEAGVWRFKCHAASCGFCGDVYDVRARRTGQTTAEVLKSLPEGGQRPSPEKFHVGTSAKKVWPTLAELESSLPKIERRYEYTDNGRVDLIVYRCIGSDGKKTFRQVHPIEGGFVMEAPPKPWPIYNRQRVRSMDVVVVVEGEKCVHALHDVGIVATTSPGGAGKAEYADWSLLAGKTVYLWPDNDAADAKTGRRTGFVHMEGVAKTLNTLAPSPTVLWIYPEPLNLPIKGDVVDYIAGLGPISRELKFQAVQDVLAEAQRIGPSQDVKRLIDDTVSGKRSAIEWPWHLMSRLSKALLPGTVTLICGDPGASKSFLLLEAAAHWQKQGIKIALYELEEDRAYHLYRTLAQETGNSKLFDDAWVRSNAEEVEGAYKHYQRWLDEFGRCLFEAPDKQVTLTDLAEWVRDRAKAGCRIIAIDPITAAESDEKPWVADLKFMMAVKTTAREYGVSVILVTHPKKGRKLAVGMDEMAGGAAYQRFAQTIIWVEHHKTPKTVIVKSPVGGTMPIEINRTIHLSKTRNGVGHGVGLAYRFQGETLRFDEKGIIQAEGSTDA